MEFQSLGAFAAGLAAMGAMVDHTLHVGLDHAAALIEETAKAEIGNYQPAWGPFVAWAPLTAATEQSKAAKGYKLNAPLLATGEMQASIQREVHGNEAVIGSKNPKLAFHELGTSHVPPRPVLGPALYRNKDQILALIGNAFVEGMLFGRVMSLGGHYNLQHSASRGL